MIDMPDPTARHRGPNRPTPTPSRTSAMEASTLWPSSDRSFLSSRTSGSGGSGTIQWSQATPCPSIISGKACPPKLMQCMKIVKGSSSFLKVI
ncbi:hypothetical protein XENOCAPTIV_021843 [Xenoophorus captivus]|uniref:Uncharacterized protein n=1 Tax=Xenoophorus captivus TaxID=1517983 RepID=A0ABV0S132_9TELE